MPEGQKRKNTFYLYGKIKCMKEQDWGIGMVDIRNESLLYTHVRTQALTWNQGFEVTAE